VADRARAEKGDAVTGDRNGQAPDADEGGDPACWLPRVCPGCGRLADEDPPTRCAGCGLELTGD
jgi:hypothetical protein